MLAVAGLIGFCSWLSIALTRPEGGVTIIWPVSGLLVGIVLTSPRRLWSAYVVAALVGSLIARAAYGDPLLAVASRGIASTLEVCIVVYALRFFVGNVSDPANLQRVARVAMVSTLLACATSALIVAATSPGLGRASFNSIFAAWFTSHVLGMVIFATLIGVARDLGTSVFGRPGRHWKFARSMALVAATTFWVFSQSRYPFLFLIYPPLLLAVFRHRFAGMVIGITVVMIISIGATVAGSGPFFLVADTSAQQRIWLLQLFIAITCLTTLPVAVMLAERGRLAAKLRESERRLHAITDNLPAMVAYVDTGQRYTFANAFIGTVFGIDPASTIGRTIREVRSEQLYASIRPHVEAALRGERVTFESEFEANGRHYYHQSNYLPDFTADGSVRGFYAMTYDISELHAAKQELQQLAHHDSLTGLANRNKFNERLTLALAKSRRNKHPIALICLDIDHFKEINDTRGHAVGDAVLREFAMRLHANVRETDLAARLGGDEFVVIIEDIDSADVPEIIARKLLVAMQRNFVVNAAELHATASIGIGFCRAGAYADALMLAADNALYEAKSAGRNTYRVAEVG